MRADSRNARVVVYAARHTLELADSRFRLAPWSDDDLIEYLLARHPQQCAAVMRRFADCEERRRMADSPQLLCLAADY